MRLISNPIVLRMAVMFVAAGFAFLFGLLLIRRMRRSITEEGSFAEAPVAAESFPMHTYHAVIQQLKQQKHELLSSQREERRRARTSENISAAVLSNLSSGVLFFTPNGLVRQANASAKQILGLAAPVGMSAAELFRDAELVSASDGAYADLAAAVGASLREKVRFRQLEAHYHTPSGEERTLDITISSVHAPDSEVLGAACLINDRTEVTMIRRQQELRGEMSAEMALGLRTSLTTISGYAQQLAASRDAGLARQLAADIADEAAQLDRTIGGFLASAKAVSAGVKA
ncbi:MAG TPA: PAS domain-containing protein [Terriglobales bacterium]|nr:PAS domain-containing protein [Terriglobales bacterium]